MISSQSIDKSIAIIGIGCRFPMSYSPEEFWANLCHGRDCIRQFPADRIGISQIYETYPDFFSGGGMLRGGFIDGFDKFDPTAFRISPRETQTMDPQHRLLLEVTWEALEDAGQPIEELSESDTSVFIGISTSDFGFEQFANFTSVDSYTNTGMAMSVAANRISYVFNLKGQSLAIDTACSSSLAAVYYGCQNLLAGNSSLALAGGVNLILSPFITYGMKKAGVLASDGKCKTFDASADGYVRGEGAGIVVLKRLSDALAAGDTIYATIEGGAINQNGKGNGLTAPSGKSQYELIKQALENSGRSAEEIDYVEAHGTGTFLGDLIEANALGKALGANRKHSRFCRIGSVKSNIGHLEAAAGIAGLIKVALSIKNNKIPPTINFTNPNPKIDFQGIGLEVQQTLGEWNDPRKMVAGISSFGFGGSNVHLILKSAPEIDRPPIENDYRDGQILTISAHSQKHLQVLTELYRNALFDENRTGTPEFASFCATSALKRSHRAYRRALIFRNSDELAEIFTAAQQNQPHPNLVNGNRYKGVCPKTAFIFSGFGGQWAKMGQDLLEKERTFADSLQKISILSEKFGGNSIVEKLGHELTTEFLNNAQECQPVIFAIQAALTDVLRSYGIRPEFVAGHSFGEIAAAYAAGILTLENAVKIITIRSRQLGKIHRKGRMAMIELPPDEIKELLKNFEGKISFAAGNSPLQTIISGDEQALEKFLEMIELKNVFCKFVNSDVAGHSHQIDPLLEDFRRSIGEIDHCPPKVRYFSGFTGREVTGRLMDSGYWAENFRKPVLFAETIRNIAEEGCELFIEIGPHPVLLASIEQTLNHYKLTADIRPSLKKNQDCYLSFLRLLSEMYALGHSPEWKNIYPTRAEKISLPTYPWIKERFYVAVAPPSGKKNQMKRPKTALTPNRPSPLLGEKIEIALDETGIYETFVSTEEFAFLKDHCVRKRVVLPGAALIEMMHSAAFEVFPDAELSVEEIEFFQPLFLDSEEGVRLQTVVRKTFDNSAEVKIMAFADTENLSAKWKLIAVGKIVVQLEGMGNALNFPKPEKIHNEPSIKEEIYKFFARNSLNYGDNFRALTRLQNTKDEVLGEFELPTQIIEQLDLYRFHPVALDVCFHLLGAKRFFEKKESSDEITFLPAKIKKIKFNRSAMPFFYGLAKNFLTETSGEEITSDISIIDADGTQLVEIEGMTCRRINLKRLLKEEKPSAKTNLFYGVDWIEKDLTAQINTDRRKVWLILPDKTGFYKQVVSIISRRNEKYLIIASETSAQRNNVEDFCNDLPGIIKNLGEIKQNVEMRLLNFRALDFGKHQMPDEMFDRTLSMVYENQILTRRLLELEIALPIEIWVCTKAGQSLLNDVLPADPLHSSLWGMGRSLQNEAPHVWGGMIDLSPSNAEIDKPELFINAVLNTEGEKQIVLRGNKLYCARLNRHLIAERKLTEKISQGNTYLITGGLGGLGLSIAEWLAENGASKLMLTGKRVFPVRDKWHQYENETPFAAKIKKLREIEKRGVSVEIHSFDVAQVGIFEDFRKTIGEAEFEKIKGIVHAAGTLQDCTVNNASTGALETVFLPKVKGFLNLMTAFDNENLEFLIVFSSSAAVLGSYGQSGYAAANAFLDAFASEKNKTTIQSINWGPWAEVGLAHSAIKQKGIGFRGIRNLVPAEGVELFGKILAAESRQITVIDVDWQELTSANPLIRQNLFFDKVRVNKNFDPSASKGGLRFSSASEQKELFDKNKLKGRSVEDQTEILFPEICRLVGNLLLTPPEKVERTAGLESLGFDSLTSMQFKNAVQNEFQVSLPIKYLLQNPTIEELSGELRRLLFETENSPTIVSKTAPSGAPHNAFESEVVQIAATVFGKTEDEVSLDFTFEKKSEAYQAIPIFEAKQAALFLHRLRKNFGIEIGINELIETPDLKNLSLSILLKQLESQGIKDIDILIGELKKLPDLTKPEK